MNGPKASARVHEGTNDQDGAGPRPPFSPGLAALATGLKGGVARCADSVRSSVLESA
jgi:hypothetical protein